MFHSRKNTGTFAAVVNRIFAEDLCQSISRGLGDQVDSKIVCHSNSIRIPALAPVWRRSRNVRSRIRGNRLLVGARNRSAEKRIRAERIEGVILQLLCFRWAMVR